MSSAPHPPGPHGHDDHAFTGEPVRVLAPDEPRTPGWLPLLGIALFTGAAVVVLVGQDPEAAAKPAAVAGAEAARPAPAPLSPPPPATPPPGARPGGTTPPSVATRLTPAQVEQLRKAQDAARAKGAR